MPFHPKTTARIKHLSTPSRLEVANSTVAPDSFTSSIPNGNLMVGASSGSPTTSSSLRDSMPNKNSNSGKTTLLIVGATLAVAYLMMRSSNY